VTVGGQLGVEDGHQPRVGETGQHGRLVALAGHGAGVQRVVAEDLDGDRHPEQEVVGAEDVGRASAAQERAEPVPHGGTLTGRGRRKGAAHPVSRSVVSRIRPRASHAAP